MCVYMYVRARTPCVYVCEAFSFTTFLFLIEWRNNACPTVNTRNELIPEVFNPLSLVSRAGQRVRDRLLATYTSPRPVFCSHATPRLEMRPP